MITMRTPYESPPLRSNDRLHWAQKAKIVKQIRTDARVMATNGIWHGKVWTGTPPVTATLIWEVTDKRRRDVGAASPTLKAWIDGMVDGGLLPFDHADIVAEERLRIEVGTRKGVRVEIRPVTE